MYTRPEVRQLAGSPERVAHGGYRKEQYVFICAIGSMGSRNASAIISV